MTGAEDLRWMDAALALAARGLGETWPNPTVACLIVSKGRLIARARTAPGGRPHAEPQALAQAGKAATGATAYVTLEPCAHHAQTPPCVRALIDAGLARVVIAQRDPDTRVDGNGIAALRAAGIAVTIGVREARASELQAGFLSRMTRARPLVTLKLATTLDGRIATASGESQWITGPAARAHVHSQRARHDAVMIGAGTARSDDPSLTIRGLGISRQPVRVVLSRSLDLARSGKLWETLDHAPLWICHGIQPPQEWSNTAARLIHCARDNTGQLDLADALHHLGSQGLTRVYCEGGGTIAAALLRAGLVDRLHLYTAGKMIGAEGQPALGALGITALKEAPHFTLTQTHVLGGDVFQAWSAAKRV